MHIGRRLVRICCAGRRRAIAGAAGRSGRLVRMAASAGLAPTAATSLGGGGLLLAWVDECRATRCVVNVEDSEDLGSRVAAAAAASGRVLPFDALLPSDGQRRRTFGRCARWCRCQMPLRCTLVVIGTVDV